MRRFVKDESGMTMGLVVIMIVLIGVMGAGLLTFVTRDLESVVEVNQGQRALEMSDAGMEAARRHLSNEDAKPSSYDPIVTAGNSSWYDNGDPNTCGRTMTFDGNQIRVCIRYLLPSVTDAQTRQPDYAPEKLPDYSPEVCNDANGDGQHDDFDPTATPPVVDACAYPNKRNYFRVTVRGGTGDAVRQVQAIYQTQNVDFPVAYFATRDINFNGNSTETNGVSFFANRYIYNLFAGTVQGEDYAYGDWITDPATGMANAYNRIARSTTEAGAAALGRDPADVLPPPNGAKISGLAYNPTSAENNQKAGTANPQLYGRRDFDKNSNISATYNKNFAPNTWGALANQPSNTITFPFETGNATADADVVARLKQKARDNGTYVRITSTASNYDDFKIRDTDRGGLFPTTSSLTDTVYFVEFADGTDDSPTYPSTPGGASYDVRNSENPDGAKGTIVVVNGSLEMDNSADDFQGVHIVRDPNPADSNILTYTKEGQVYLQGFINVQGDISLSGNVDGLLPGSLVNGLPGLINVKLWSWRECYSTTCN